MAMKYHKILVAVDGSKTSELAFKKAVEIAKRNDAKLLITHVINTRAYSSIEAYDQGISQRIENDGLQLVNNYKERAEKADCQDVITILETGSPKVKIPKEIAPKNDVDLIICGATGLNTVERFFIGSVSEHITRFATTDVLVVRSSVENEE